jgi:hypothetical protein
MIPHVQRHTQELVLLLPHVPPDREGREEQPVLVLRRVVPAAVVGARQHDEGVALVHVGEDAVVDVGWIGVIRCPEVALWDELRSPVLLCDSRAGYEQPEGGLPVPVPLIIPP